MKLNNKIQLGFLAIVMTFFSLTSEAKSLETEVQKSDSAKTDSLNTSVGEYQGLKSLYFGIGHITHMRSVEKIQYSAEEPMEKSVYNDNGNSTNYNLFLGARQKYYGLELGHLNLKDEMGFMSYNSHTSLKLMGYLPLYQFSENTKLEAFAGVGYSYYRGDRQYKSDFVPVFSAGLQAKLHQNVSVRLAYDHFHRQNLTYRHPELDTANTVGRVSTGTASFSVIFHM